MTRHNDLDELATMLLTAIEKARGLRLPTSAYILSMALIEVSRASKAAADEDKAATDDDAE